MNTAIKTINISFIDYKIKWNAFPKHILNVSSDFNVFQVLEKTTRQAKLRPEQISILLASSVSST